MKRVFCVGNGESRRNVNLDAYESLVRYMVVMLCIEILHLMY